MGITLEVLDDLRQKGLLKKGGTVLDIGSSNLYSAYAEEIRSFLLHFGVDQDTAFINRVAAGSSYGHGRAANESFVGELLEKAGMTYLALDIANGFRTRIFDLNNETIPRVFARSFDVVLNFGTTEHVVNQLNCFRVIHDATRVGGSIVHQVPTTGYIDHGYFCYTPRFFFDLAAYNNYELTAFRYSGPAPGNDSYDVVRDYIPYFPALEASISDPFAVPSRTLFIVLRKTVHAPLNLPKERSTSVVRPAVETIRNRLNNFFSRARAG